MDLVRISINKHILYSITNIECLADDIGLIPSELKSMLYVTHTNNTVQ